MNQTQIIETLKKYDNTYVEDELLDLKKISMIFTDHDVRIYTSPKDTRFLFDATTQTLQIWKGKIVKGQFISYSESPLSFIPYDAIGGFIQTSKTGPNGMIMYR